jgi:hypothetical protein
MLDVFEALLKEKNILDPEGRIAGVIGAWRKTRGEKVRYTRHQVNQMINFFNRISACVELSAQEKANHIARALDYKMQYEIQEEWERKTEWIEAPEEIVSKIKKLDIGKYGQVVGEYPGKSDYLVIVIDQFHRGLSTAVAPEIIEAQREIAAIEDMLIDHGIANVLAVEGSDTKEIALELAEPPRPKNLVDYRDFLRDASDPENPSINDLLAGFYGGGLWQEGHHRYALHTFGVETPEVHDKAATFNLLTKELVGALRDLAYFGDREKAFFGEESEGDSDGTFPKAGLLARLERTLKTSGAGDVTVQQAMETLTQSWQTKEQLTSDDILAAARTAHKLMWELSINTRNLFFPVNIEQIRENTLTNAIIFVVGVYHNKKHHDEEVSTLTEALLDYGISHIVIRPHTVKRILDRQAQRL